MGCALPFYYGMVATSGAGIGYGKSNKAVVTITFHPCRIVESRGNGVVGEDDMIMGWFALAHMVAYFH